MGDVREKKRVIKKKKKKIKRGVEYLKKNKMK
jgi:hypothetical protein